MDFAISSARPAHYRLMANAVARRGHRLTMYTSAPGSKFAQGWPPMTRRFVPEMAGILGTLLTGIRFPQRLHEAANVLYDRLTMLRLGQHDIVAAGSTGCLETGRAVQRRGGRFVVDRACPYAPFQQELVRAEAEKAGGGFQPDAPWFLERQLKEYEAADVILSPSEYSRRTFPERLASKVVLAPLFGRVKVAPHRPRVAGEIFRVGVVGGNPLRKGYLYLLEAWKQLALPNAELIIRSSADFGEFPRLKELMGPNVRQVGHFANINHFYEQLDLFVLPSVDDGFGMALFEAIANGVPCVATTHCGAVELLDAGRDAAVVEPFSAAELGEAIERLYGDREYRESVARRGWETVSSMVAEDGAVPAQYQAGIDEMLARLTH